MAEHRVVLCQGIGHSSLVRNERVSVARSNMIQISAGYEADALGTLAASLFQGSAEFMELIAKLSEIIIVVEDVMRQRTQYGQDGKVVPLPKEILEEHHLKLNHMLGGVKKRMSMKCRLVVTLQVVLLLICGGISRGEQLNSIIETQVLRVFATKRSGYYHKPWKSPDFRHVKGSAFFFSDERLYPGGKGLILTNAHAVSQAQSIKVSNGKEKRRYQVKLVGLCNSADFAVLQMETQELEAYERRNGKVKPLQLGDSDPLRVGDKVMGWGYPLGGERISKSEQGEIS